MWSGACVLFVFSALLEFAFVNYASRSDRRKGKLKYNNPFLGNSSAYFDPDDHLDDDDGEVGRNYHKKAWIEFGLRWTGVGLRRWRGLAGRPPAGGAAVQ